MALSPVEAQEALIAFQRFGLGPKPGGSARIGRNPLAALKAEVNTAGIATVRASGLPSYAKACYESQKGLDRAEAQRQLELTARLDKQRSVEIGFLERLVMFWSNHFSMTIHKAMAVRGTIGQWERDVIRRHVLGKFSNMLIGTMTHPAMIAYLDNDDSIGPNSPTGQRWGAGFNENLARELLELHTVGSGGGYTEQDVSALAKILTGWSYVSAWEADNNRYGGSDANRGRFIYRSDWHEPGAMTVMGRTYAATGQSQAISALNALAAHPATAEHIAFKLVRHFITDTPTAAMVNPIKQKFLATRGDLKAVSIALLDLPEAWSTPLKKIRTPQEFMVAQYRALGQRYQSSEPWMLKEPLKSLHNMVWEAPSPEGYSDDTPTWLNPDGMRTRLDVALLQAWRLARHMNLSASNLAAALFDSALSSVTRDRIAGARDQTAGLIVLLTSPEMQRR